MRFQNIRLPQRDQFLILLLVIREVEKRERLKRGAKPILDSSGASRQAADQPRVPSQANNNLVCLREIVGSENQCFGIDKPHVHQSGRKYNTQLSANPIIMNSAKT